jgi:hypothetical protein
MRNIYEIISEQKAIVDVNIANYDLMYTTNIFVKENEYIQEGFGDKVKSVIKSVIEFIKSLINKIREFVSKIFNFFRGGKNEVAKIENKLKEAKDKDNGGKEEAKDDDKKEKGGSTEVKGEAGTLMNISFTGDATTLPQLLKVTKGKAVTTKIGPIEAKFDMIDKIFQAGEIFEKIGGMEADNVDPEILSKTAKKILTGDENTNDVMSKIKEKLGDSDETVQFEISSKAGEIIKYLEYSQKLGVNFKAGANELIGDLNETIRELEEEARKVGTPEAEKNAAAAASEIRKCCNIITSTLSYVGQKSLKGYTQYLRICRRLCDMYISSRLPNMDNRNRTKSRNQMINSVEKKDKFEEKAKEYGIDKGED